jgi:hypothetical protein
MSSRGSRFSHTVLRVWQPLPAHLWTWSDDRRRGDTAGRPSARLFDTLADRRIAVEINLLATARSWGSPGPTTPCGTTSASAYRWSSAPMMKASPGPTSPTNGCRRFPNIDSPTPISSVWPATVSSTAFSEARAFGSRLQRASIGASHHAAASASTQRRTLLLMIVNTCSRRTRSGSVWFGTLYGAHALKRDGIRLVPRRVGRIRIAFARPALWL